MGLQYKCEQAQNHFTSKPEQAVITSIFNFSVTCFSRTQSSVHISKSVCATLHTITVHVHSRISDDLVSASRSHMFKKTGTYDKKKISVFNRGMTSYPLYLEEKKSLFFGSDTGSQICQFSGCT